jgi:hypothetical protein
MPARATPFAGNVVFAGLRRSGLGAWLAAAYALAVLAAGLAPAPALATSFRMAGAVLCSGSPMPGPDVPAPAGEAAHCKGCPLNPVLAGPAAEQPAIPARATVPVAASRSLTEGLPRGVVTGLPGSRAPPALASHS